MRVVFIVAILALVAVPGFSQPAAPAISPGAERNEARWADWEAQARIADGDHEGALQAERQADTDRRAAVARETRSH